MAFMFVFYSRLSDKSSNLSSSQFGTPAGSGLCYMLGRAAFPCERYREGQLLKHTEFLSIFQVDVDLDIQMDTNSITWYSNLLLDANISDNSPRDRWERWGPERRNELSQQSIHGQAHSRFSIVIWLYWLSIMVKGTGIGVRQIGDMPWLLIPGNTIGQETWSLWASVFPTVKWE